MSERNPVKVSDWGNLSGLPLELDEAIGLCGGSLEGYLEVAQAFLEHVPQLEKALDEARGSAELVPVVHEAATSLGIVGATVASRRARELEAALREQREIDVTAALAAVRRDIGAAVQAVRQVRAREGKGIASPFESDRKSSPMNFPCTG